MPKEKSFDLGILYDTAVAPQLYPKAVVLDRKDLKTVMQALIADLLQPISGSAMRELTSFRDDELKFYLKGFYNEILFDRGAELIACEVKPGKWEVIEYPSDLLNIAEKYYGGVRKFFEFFVRGIKDKSAYKRVDLYDLPIVSVCFYRTFEYIRASLAYYLLGQEGNLERHVVRFFNEYVREGKVNGMLCEIERDEYVLIKTAKEFVDLLKKLYGSLEEFAEEEAPNFLILYRNMG
jgi:hypothetical protein